jgi:hypothetical protein
MTGEQSGKGGGNRELKAERQRRLAEALRANLKRRKTAARPASPEVKRLPKPPRSDLE